MRWLDGITDSMAMNLDPGQWVQSVCMVGVGPCNCTGQWVQSVCMVGVGRVTALARGCGGRACVTSRGASQVL